MPFSIKVFCSTITSTVSSNPSLRTIPFHCWVGVLKWLRVLDWTVMQLDFKHIGQTFHCWIFFGLTWNLYHLLEVLWKELLYSVKKHHLSSEKSNFWKCSPLVPGLKSVKRYQTASWKEEKKWKKSKFQCGRDFSLEF